jgi:hypothetical protein
MSTPPKAPTPALMESKRYAVKGGKIFEFKGLRGKILKTKGIGLQDRCLYGTALIDMVWPVGS